MYTDKQKLLNIFIAGAYDPRHYIKKPFLAGDYYSATNGHMIVFIENDGSMPEIEKCQLSESQKVLKLIAHSKLKPEYTISMPENTAPLKMKECPKCHGTGKIECFNCGHDEDCEYCDGSGSTEDFVSILTDEGIRFASHYLHTLKTLGATIEVGNEHDSSYIFRGETHGIKYFGAINTCRAA